MAKDSIGFVLSDETRGNLDQAITQLKDYKTNGWTITDVRIETQTKDGQKVSVGMIDVQK